MSWKVRHFQGNRWKKLMVGSESCRSQASRARGASPGTGGPISDARCILNALNCVQALIPSEWILKSPPPEDVLDVTGIPASCGVLTADEIKITETDAQELVEKLKKRALSAFEVTQAFCKRAAVAQALVIHCGPDVIATVPHTLGFQVNPLTEILFKEGLERAKELDAIYERTGKPVGPLHGLPLSIASLPRDPSRERADRCLGWTEQKDNFKIKGYDATLGFISYCHQPVDEDSVLITILRSLGAVLYVKTLVAFCTLVTPGPWLTRRAGTFLWL
jgi:amidase